MKQCLLAYALALSSLTASAGVINFDGHDNTIIGDEDISNGIASFSIGGYLFSNAADHFHLVDMAQFGDPGNGTSSLLSDRGSLLTMTRGGGRNFDLARLDGFGYFSDRLTVTGYFAAGGSISADFAMTAGSMTTLDLIGFRGVNRVTFAGSPETISAPAGFGIDNVLVHHARINDEVQLPEPFTLGLTGLALGAISLARRRQPPPPSGSDHLKFATIAQSRWSDPDGIRRLLIHRGQTTYIVQ